MQRLSTYYRKKDDEFEIPKLKEEAKQNNATSDSSVNLPSYVPNSYSYKSSENKVTEPNYSDIRNQTIEKILNREPFSYDVNGDALYDEYKSRYKENARLAMEDTIGSMSALTGGYGNSYAQIAGQKAYSDQMSGLTTDVIPSLYALAEQRYNNETSDLYDKYNLVNSLVSSNVSSVTTPSVSESADIVDKMREMALSGDVSGITTYINALQEAGFDPSFVEALKNQWEGYAKFALTTSKLKNESEEDHRNWLNWAFNSGEADQWLKDNGLYTGEIDTTVDDDIDNPEEIQTSDYSWKSSSPLPFGTLNKSIDETGVPAIAIAKEINKLAPISVTRTTDRVMDIIDAIKNKDANLLFDRSKYDSYFDYLLDYLFENRNKKETK